MRLSNTCSNPLIKISASPYTTLQDAFSAATGGSTIKSRAVVTTENPVFNKPGVSATLQGGYACDFLSHPQNTVLIGSLTIKSGTLNISNISIQ